MIILDGWIPGCTITGVRIIAFPSVDCWSGVLITVIPGRIWGPVITCEVLVVPPEPEVLGLIVTVAVLGWNEVKVCWLVPVLDGMIPRTFCCTWTTPEFDWPCLTHVAKVWWKFLFCWNVTVAGDPTLVVRTILVPVVTEPLMGATITFCAGEMVLVVLFVGEVVEAAITVGFCCSNRF